jgi:hypothetical protein
MVAWGMGWSSRKKALQRAKGSFGNNRHVHYMSIVEK